MTKILIVEDNEVNRDMLSRRLRKKGYDVVIAVDGQEGIDKAKDGKPDLILMDISLPGMDGMEATRRLKADESTRAIPVIALTAHAMEGDREQAMAAGCDEYESKPVEFDQLLSKIRKVIGDR